MEQVSYDEFISEFARLLGGLADKEKAMVQGVLDVLDQEQEKAV